MVYKFWNDRSHGQTVRRCELSNFVLSQTNNVISGCGVTWDTAMNVNIASGTIYINDGEVSVTGTSKTISNGDGSNPRLDLIAINSSGVVSVIEGTPASVPMTPTYVETDYVIVCMIYVPTSATTISATEIENIGLVNGGYSAAVGLGRYANSFLTQTNMNINHSLNDSNPVVQVYDSTGEQITPDVIDVIDANNINIQFSSSTSGSYIIHGGNSGIVNSSNDIIPTTDVTYDVGSSTYRFQNGYFQNVHTGDLVLQNGWTIVEYDEDYTQIEGVIIRDKNKKEVFKIDNDGIYFKGKKLKLDFE